jgi:hypothetical protein
MTHRLSPATLQKALGLLLGFAPAAFGATPVTTLTAATAAPQPPVATVTTSIGRSYPDLEYQSVAPQPRHLVPLFTLLGIPVVVSAPVAPPYTGSAYQNLGGQPETSTDAILGASLHNE